VRVQLMGVCVCVCVRVHVCICARANVDVGVDVCLYVCEYKSKKHIRWPDRIICDICSDQLMRQRAPCPLA